MNFMLIIWTLTAGVTGQLATQVTTIPMSSPQVCAAALPKVTKDVPWKFDNKTGGYKTWAECVQVQ